MSTPAAAPLVRFQSILDPELLKTYNLVLPATSQSNAFPKTFLDCLSVRDIVFSQEQKAVPLKHLLDRDDARSCLMVLYSPDLITEPIGTIRLVPSPHHLHPKPGAHFDVPGDDVPDVSAAELFTASVPKHARDRATDLHDGVEPYVKLGRLCVVKEHRGKRYADLLIQQMLQWISENQRFACGGDGGEWKGLVGIHARVKALGTWKRNGFVVDEGMGSWFEVGLEHVGMFLRLELN